MTVAENIKRIGAAVLTGIGIAALGGCGSTQAVPAADAGKEASGAEEQKQGTADNEKESDATQDASTDSFSQDFAPEDDTAPEALEDVTEGEELLCLAESEEEARKIAEQYGIEFVEYSYGVATFHTEEDLQMVIDMGKEKGYPELSINGTSKLY